MALLPKYQKTGIRVRQPNNIDFAAAREEARFSQVMSQQLDRMSEFAFKEASLQAEERGRERVREQGAINTLKQLEAEGGPRTITERSAFEAANRVAVVEIETAARSDMRTLITQADESNMSLSVFDQKMSDIRDGYTASLQVVDPVMAGVLGARLQEDSVSFDNRYAEIVSRKAKAAWAANTEVILNEGVQKIMDAALQEGSDVKNENGQNPLEKAAADLLAVAESRGVNQKKAQKLVDNALNSALRENVMFRFNNAAGIPEKQAILAELEDSDTFAGMNYEQSFNFKLRLQGGIDREITEGRVEWGESYDNAMKFIAQTGRFPDGFSPDEESLSVLFAQDPENLDYMLRSLNIAEDDAVKYGGLSAMTFERSSEVVAEMIDDYNTAVAENRSADEIKALNDRRIAFQTAASDKLAAIQTDAAQYILDTNQEAAISANKLMQALSAGNIDGATQNVTALQTQLNNAYNQIGVPTDYRRVVPKKMAADIVGMLETQAAENPSIAAALFQEYRNVFGDQSNAFLLNLKQAGLKPEFAEAMLTNKPGVQDELMKLVNEDVETLKDRVKPGKASEAMNMLKEQLAPYQSAYLQGGGNIAGEDFDSAMAVAEKYLYDYMSKHSGSEGDPQNAVKYVLANMFPEYENVINDANGNYIVDLNYNANEIDSMLGNFFGRQGVQMLEKLDVQPLNMATTPEAQGYIDEAVSLTNLARQGYFLNNQTGDGVVLHYRTKTGKLIMAKNSQGEPIDIKFKDLRRTINMLQVDPDGVTPAQVEETSVAPAGAEMPGFEDAVSPEAMRNIEAGLEGAFPQPSGFTAEVVPADQAASVAERNKAKTDLQQEYLNSYPDDATTKEKKEYFELSLSEVRDPEIGPDQMTSFEDFRKSKEQETDQAKQDAKKDRIFNKLIDAIPEGESASDKSAYSKFLKKRMSLDPSIGSPGTITVAYEVWKNNREEEEDLNFRLEAYADEDIPTPLKLEDTPIKLGDALVQLGSYETEGQAKGAYKVLYKKHPELKEYSPVIQRVERAKQGNVTAKVRYLLRLYGFENRAEAIKFSGSTDFKASVVQAR